MSAGEVGRALSGCRGAAGDICSTSSHTLSPAFSGSPAGIARARLQQPSHNKGGDVSHLQTFAFAMPATRNASAETPGTLYVSSSDICTKPVLSKPFTRETRLASAPTAHVMHIVLLFVGS